MLNFTSSSTTLQSGQHKNDPCLTRHVALCIFETTHNSHEKLWREKQIQYKMEVMHGIEKLLSHNLPTSFTEPYCFCFHKVLSKQGLMISTDIMFQGCFNLLGPRKDENGRHGEEGKRKDERRRK